MAEEWNDQSLTDDTQCTPSTIPLSSVSIISTGTATTSVTEAWFSKDQVGSSTGIYDRVYAINCTSSFNSPKFPTLIEYNTFNTDTVVTSDYCALGQWGYCTTPEAMGYYIGESLNIDKIAMSKIIFPASLKQLGYNSMLLYSGKPAYTDWYSCAHNSACMASTDYLYRISLIKDECTGQICCPDLDTIIQFTSITDESLNNETSEAGSHCPGYTVYNCIHTCNFSNPHSDQVSHIGTTDLNGYITSKVHYAALTSPFNGLMIGNTLIASDYAMKYVGDQVVLEKPMYIASDGYYKFNNEYQGGYAVWERCGCINASNIVYPGRDYSYLVLAGPSSASSIDTDIQITGVRCSTTCGYLNGCIGCPECAVYGCDYYGQPTGVGNEHFPEWETGSDINCIYSSVFFNPLDGHQYTCIHIQNVNIYQFQITATAVENETKKCSYCVSILNNTPKSVRLIMNDGDDCIYALRPRDGSESTYSDAWSACMHTCREYFFDDACQCQIEGSASFECQCYEVIPERGFFDTTYIDNTDDNTRNAVICPATLQCISTQISCTDTLTRGLLHRTSLLLNVDVYEATVGQINGNNLSTLTTCIEPLFFTLAPTGVEFDFTCTIDPIDYQNNACVNINWITLPYKSFVNIDDEIYARCSYVFDECRNASPYIDQIKVCYLYNSHTYEMCNTSTYTFSQNCDLGCCPIVYCENGTLTFPVLQPMTNIVGDGLACTYPDALAFYGAPNLQAICIPITTYYTNASMRVSNTGIICCENNKYYLIGNCINVCGGGLPDIEIEATPYNANHCTPYFGVVDNCSLLDYRNGYWYKCPTSCNRTWLDEHPATICVTYDTYYNDGTCQFAACIPIYVCYDLEQISLISTQNIELYEDAYGDQYINFIAPSYTASWDIPTLIHVSPDAATYDICYNVPSEYSLCNSLSVDSCGQLSLAINEQGLAPEYGRGALVISANKLSDTTMCISKTLYVCVTYVEPVPLYYVTASLPEDVSLINTTPADLTNLQDNTTVTFSLDNQSGHTIAHVYANGVEIQAVSGVYTTIINGSNIEITAEFAPEPTYDVTIGTLPTGINVTDFNLPDITDLLSGTLVTFRVINTSTYTITAVKANQIVLTPSSDVYSFIITDSDVEITVEIESEPINNEEPNDNNDEEPINSEEPPNSENGEGE